MNYLKYFPKLSKIERLLFDEGFLKVGWACKTREVGLCVMHTQKFSQMMTDFSKSLDLKTEIITEEIILDYLKNPKKYKSENARRWTKTTT